MWLYIHPYPPPPPPLFLLFFITSKPLKALRWNFGSLNKINLPYFQVKTEFLYRFCLWENDSKIEFWSVYYLSPNVRLHQSLFLKEYYWKVQHHTMSAVPRHIFVLLNWYGYPNNKPNFSRSSFIKDLWPDWEVHFKPI